VATDQLELELELEPAEPAGRSPQELYGPFPDGMHYVVWRTLAAWELADWWRLRDGAG
jgi:hypothetical protein